MGTRASVDGESTHCEASVLVVRALSRRLRGAPVPGKRLRGLSETRARGAAGNAVEHVRSEGRLHAQLERVPRPGEVLISMREPAERQGRSQAGDRLLEARGGR